MRNIESSTRAAVLALLLGCAAGSALAADAFPSRPIRMLVPFSAGGASDGPARIFAAEINRLSGQQMLVENRPGAGSVLGAEIAAKSTPDGYTLFMISNTHYVSAAIHRKLPYDAIADFTHMAMLVEAPMVLLVRPQSPFKTLADYVAAARVKPVRYGSSGIGSANHLFGEMLKIEGNAPMHDHVPYQGSAPALAELLGGQIDSVLDPITTNVDQLKGGSLRALAVSTPARLPGLPDIPTFAEAGFPSLTGSQWLGMSAPKGLPAPIAQRLTSLMPEILARPDIMKRLDDLQTLPRKSPVTGAEFNKLIESQITTWSAVARRAKVEVIA